MAERSGNAAHWDDAYTQGDVTRSWFQQHPATSLRMLDAAGVTPGDSLIDVGGGASHLVDALLDKGYRDLTVLDISPAGLAHAQRRLAGRANQVRWLVADLLAWEPLRHYRVWHDRAVFHFQAIPAAKDKYLSVLEAATEPDSAAVFGCFAPDGPRQCSGLPVARYSAAELADLLSPKWALVTQAREEHTTPAGVIQPFTWAVLRKQADP